MPFVILFFLAIAFRSDAASTALLNGKNLDGWETVGDGVWTVMKDGTLVGQRYLSPERSHGQAWLYTKKEYGEFDLHLEWWLRLDGNSGVSIRDTSRGQYAVGPNQNGAKTPAHIGYEIQLISRDTEQKYPTGSVYLFHAAKPGVQRESDWNTLDVEVRASHIRVKVNGQLVSESDSDPSRPKRGPIGFQLHDGNTVVMFRNVRITELKR